jgi:ubiquinone/menaquinone biosynthesis C-methylase UbiE
MAPMAEVGQSQPRRPTPELFDGVFSDIARGRRLNELFDEVMGPFPPHVEPYSMVTRPGLDHVLSLLELEPGAHLVDLCCGRGGIGLWFAQESGASVTGVDFSPAAIAEAERRAELFLGVRATFRVADARETPLEAQSVDALVCIDALQMLPERDRVLGEVGRLLRPGGRAVFTTWETDVKGGVLGQNPMSNVGRLVEAAGLRVVTREEHPEWDERQRLMFGTAIAEDGDSAEPAVKQLAEEGRRALPRMHDARRVLVALTTAA